MPVSNPLPTATLPGASATPSGIGPQEATTAPTNTPATNPYAAWNAQGLSFTGNSGVMGGDTAHLISNLQDSSGRQIASWQPQQNPLTDTPSLAAGVKYNNGQFDLSGMTAVPNGGGGGGGGAPAVAPSGLLAAQVTPTAAMTVAGQLQNNLDPNSPLIQQAQAAALGAMNQRGLLNSSMAQTAGQQAAYNVALPISQADAATAAGLGQFNVGQANTLTGQQLASQTQLQTTGMTTAAQQAIAAQEAQTARQNALLASQTQLGTTGMTTQSQQAIAAQEAQTARQNAALASQTQLSTTGMTTQSQQAVAQLQAQTQVTMTNLDSANKLSLAQVQATYQNQMQGNASVANVYSQLLGTINTIQGSTMNEAAKTTAINNQITVAKSALAGITAVGGLQTDVSGLLNFSAAPTGAATAPTVPSPAANGGPSGLAGFGA